MAKEEERISWDDYFLEIAEVVSKRSTCVRSKVGAVITSNNRILSTGYNGAPPGKPHCTHAGCFLVGGNCRRTIHAEINAINELRLLKTKEATLYCNKGCPCPICIWNAYVLGVTRIVYTGNYAHNIYQSMTERLGMVVKQVLTRE